MSKQAQDISDEEETLLPLPINWIRLLRSDSKKPFYKNVQTNVVSEEHPFILNALIAARNLTLSPGW